MQFGLDAAGRSSRTATTCRPGSRSSSSRRGSPTRSASTRSPRACTTAAPRGRACSSCRSSRASWRRRRTCGSTSGSSCCRSTSRSTSPEQIATVDVMSGGKVIFGVALGYRDVEFLAFGTTQKERVRRFEENLEAVRRLWTEDSVDMVGVPLHVEGRLGVAAPVQKPHPPIWIGANADPAIRRAARLGDCWYVNPHNRIDTIVRQVEVYRRALDEYGKPFPAEFPARREVFVARSRSEAIRLCAPFLSAKYKAYHAVGPGPRDARRRQRPRRRVRRADPRPIPDRLARRGRRADAGARARDRDQPSDHERAVARDAAEPGAGSAAHAGRRTCFRRCRGAPDKRRREPCQRKRSFRSNRPRANPNLSPATKFGNLVFVSGQTGRHPVTGEVGKDIREQTRNVLERIKTILAAAGTSLDNVLTATTLPDQA